MKSFLTFTKGERVAIIILAAVIFLIIAANFFIANHPSNVNKHLHNLDSIIALHENAVEEYYRQQSYKDAKSQSRKDTKTQNYKVAETQGHKDTKTQKHRVTKTPSKSSEFKVQSSVVPEPVEGKIRRFDKLSDRSTQSSEFIKINSTDTTDLKSLPGIGSFFAKNIVEYREKLGGFVEKKQLLEVYAFDTARMTNIENLIVIDSIEVRKIKVNSDDFKTILRHPYIEYEDVKKIINYRESKGMIKNWETYLKIVGKDVDDRLERYVDFRN